MLNELSRFAASGAKSEVAREERPDGDAPEGTEGFEAKADIPT